jgi:hypothetical protein
MEYIKTGLIKKVSKNELNIYVKTKHPMHRWSTPLGNNEPRQNHKQTKVFSAPNGCK